MKPISPAVISAASMSNPEILLGKLNLSEATKNLMQKEGEALNAEAISRTPIRHADPGAAPNSIQLRNAPGWLAAVNKAPNNGFTSPSHNFVMVGDPGQGTRSGAAYYSISSDEKRGGVDVNESFVAAVKNLAGKESNADPRKLGAGVQTAILQLQGRSFFSREQFFSEYQRVRKELEPNVKNETVHQEIQKLYLIVPKEKMELWQREPNGRFIENPSLADGNKQNLTNNKRPNLVENKSPNLAERDIRTFENIKGVDANSGKDFQELSKAEKLSGNTLLFGKDIIANTIYLRHVPSADSLALLEVKRSYYLQRLYVDELHGRDGSGFPSPEPEKAFVSAENLSRVVSATPTYQYTPPFTDKGGNCSTGAATFLRQAGVEEENIKSPSAFAFGLHHEIQTWNPVKEQTGSTSQPVESEAIDKRSLRNGAIDTTALNKILLDRTKELASTQGSTPSSGTKQTDQIRSKL